MTHAVLARELKYVFLSIDSVSKNESSWNYLRGLASYHPELNEEIILKYVNDMQITSVFFCIFTERCLSGELVLKLSNFECVHFLVDELCKVSSVRRYCS